MTTQVEGVRSYTQNKALFSQGIIAGALEDAPGGMHIVLKGIAHSGVNLLAIG